MRSPSGRVAAALYPFPNPSRSRYLLSANDYLPPACNTFASRNLLQSSEEKLEEMEGSTRPLRGSECERKKRSEEWKSWTHSSATVGVTWMPRERWNLI